MNVETTTMDPRIAKIHYGDYMKRCKEHQERRLKAAEEQRLVSSRAYRSARNTISDIEKEDRQLLAAYKALRKGQTILHLGRVLVNAGLNEQQLPNLAVARANSKWCYLRYVWQQHRTVMFVSSDREHRPSSPNKADREIMPFKEGLSGNLTDFDWRRRNGHPEVQGARALVPSIPAHLRPLDIDKGRYHILWEAEWQSSPPHDPLLIKRIDNSDFFVVLAQWDTTPLERQVLAGRFT